MKYLFVSLDFVQENVVGELPGFEEAKLLHHLLVLGEKFLILLLQFPQVRKHLVIHSVGFESNVFPTELNVDFLQMSFLGEQLLHPAIVLLLHFPDDILGSAVDHNVLLVQLDLVVLFLQSLYFLVETLQLALKIELLGRESLVLLVELAQLPENFLVFVVHHLELLALLALLCLEQLGSVYQSQDLLHPLARELLDLSEEVPNSEQLFPKLFQLVLVCKLAEVDSVFESFKFLDHLHVLLEEFGLFLADRVHVLVGQLIEGSLGLYLGKFSFHYFEL